MGEAHLIDTSACSKYIQQLLPEVAADLMDRVVDSSCQMSVITRIELLSWITGDRTLDEDIREFISRSTSTDLSEPIIQQTVKLRRHYRGLKLPDAIIADTAIVKASRFSRPTTAISHPNNRPKIPKPERVTT